MNKKNIEILLLSLTFILSSFIISFGIKAVGVKNEHYITVKGLSEKEVIANSSNWTIQYDIVGNSVSEINNLNNSNISKVKLFFIKYGFNENDINISSLNFGVGNYQGAVYKYNANVSLSISTNEIEKMEIAHKNIMELYNSGVLLSSYYGPIYNFDKINDIKPEMIADSIKNANIAALEFVSNSNSSLGKIKNASQGYFEFLPIDRSTKSHELYPKKILRVVTTVSYYLN